MATVAVIGATGSLGRAVVEAALARGLTVRALARRTAAFDLAHASLTVVAGDVADADALERVVDGSDAVIWCVGWTRGEDPAAYGAGIRMLARAMGARGVRRLVAISGAGLVLEGDAMPLSRRLIVLALRVFAGALLAGKEHEWRALADTGLDWTVVRVARMVRGGAVGRVAVDPDRVSGRPVVAYADVAGWMLDEADARRFVGRAPFVSGG